MEERLFQATAAGSVREQAQKPRQEGQSPSGSHCILLENIDIYFSSQLELNTILPGLKRNKTQTKTLRKCPQPHAYLP